MACSGPSAVLGCTAPGLDPGPDATFPFEGDHEALRGNPDYVRLLQALAVLEAQRERAVRDVDALLEAKEAAMRDPLALVERLQRGEGLGGLPARQVLQEVPEIEWEKYETRAMMGAVTKTTRSSTETRKREAPPPAAATAAAATKNQPLMVRGRPYDDRKPQTFNQPWTREEQRRLEELLVLHPSEDVEMERWKKIAAALGNRTAVQVQSRTQKYFLKLHKAGLPIPGKIKASRHSRNAAASRKAASGLMGTAVAAAGSLASQKNSTFFPSLAPAVKMEEDGEDDGPPVFESSNGGQGRRGPILNDGFYLEEEDVSDDDSVPAAARASPAYAELLWLKRVRRERELEHSRGAPFVHAGFRCDGCNVEPIVGGRFQCVVCLDEDTVDFCCECAPKGIEVGRHKRDHEMRPVRRKRALVDMEYAVNTSYLDPNFMK